MDTANRESHQGRHKDWKQVYEGKEAQEISQRLMEKERDEG